MWKPESATLVKEEWKPKSATLVEPEATDQPPSTFWQKTKQAWDIGGRQVDLDFQWRDVKYGRMTRKQAEKNETEFNKYLKTNPLNARNWLERLYLKTVGIAHPMVSGEAKGLTYGTIGAGVGALLIPAPDPLDIATVPSGFAIGHTVGAFSYWAEQGEGSIYKEAIEANLSHKTASIVSSIGGPIYGAIEFSQVDKLIPGLGRFGKKTVLKAIVGYLKRIGVEVLEEGEQKVVTEGVTKLLGKALEDKIALADIPEEAKKIGLSAVSEMKEAIGPMTLLALPSGAIDVGRAGYAEAEQVTSLDKKSQQFKEVALTREGAEIMAAENPEIAAKIAAKEAPSRNDVKELGITGWNAEERTKLASLFRDALKPETEGKTAREEEIVAEKEAEALPEPPGEEAELPAEPTKVTKEPWEMTSQEYKDFNLQVLKKTRLKGEPEITQHKDKIKYAIEQGKPVPAEVLAEYKSEKWAQEALAKPATAKPKKKGLKEKPKEEPIAKPAEPKRIISKEAYEKARNRLIDPTKLRMGLDPQGFADIVTIGAYHFESGVRKFSTWSAKMIEELGDMVKPHLQTVYDRVIAERKPKKGTKARKEFEAETRERGFITSVKETFPEMADRVAGQYIPRSTDKLAIKAKNLIKDDINTAEKLARTSTNDKAVATASELIKHYNAMAEAATDQAAKKTFYEKAANIAHPAAANLTEVGRAVQAASILGIMTPEGQLRFAAGTINAYNEKQKRGHKKLPQLTSEQTEEILKRTRAIEKTPDGEGKAKEFWKLQNYISSLVPTPLWKKLINVWKAGLLTGLKTSGLNTFSNLAHGISEIVKDVPATGFDVMFSPFTKKRTIGLTVRGVPSGLKTGAARGWRYLKTGFDERNVAAKLDYHRVDMGKSKFAKAVGAYTDAIFRMMGAEDQPFYYGALARSLYSQAIAKAKNKGLKSREAKTYIENQVENPTDTMLNYAVQDALIAVYQNKTLLGKIGKKFQEMPVIGEVIAPFVRTPSAVAMQIIQYSPVGVVKTVIENVGKGRFDQRLMSQGLARGLLGTGVLYVGTQLFIMGFMSLGRPRGEREKKLWEIEGRKPNSIKIGGKWRDVQVLGPIGPVLLIGGYFQQALESTGSPTNAMVTAIAGGAKSFSEQTFVRGINIAASAVADPERSFELFFSSLAGSIVPTIISDIARAKDTKGRRSKGPVQRIQTRIPGLREWLEPRIDVFGNDLPRYGGNVLEVMLDPTRPFKINEDVVVDELRRLWDKGYKVSPTQLGYKYGYEFLTPEENTEMWYAVGSLTYERLHQLLHTPEYKGYGDEAKAKTIEKTIDIVKEQIKIRMRIKQKKRIFEEKAAVSPTLQKR